MKKYMSDLTEKQYEIIKNLLPEPSRRVRPVIWDFMIILNAIIYILRSGCAWSMLPKDFPPWQTVYYYFSRLRQLRI